MDSKTRTDMDQNVELRRKRRMQKVTIAKQIAHILAENRATCSELPEIWELVPQMLVVQVEN